MGSNPGYLLKSFLLYLGHVPTLTSLYGHDRFLTAILHRSLRNCLFVFISVHSLSIFYLDSCFQTEKISGKNWLFDITNKILVESSTYLHFSLFHQENLELLSLNFPLISIVKPTLSFIS